MKKNVCFPFKYARLRKHTRKNLPYFDILFYQTQPRKTFREPHQKTFGINKIRNLELREKEGLKIVNQINRVLHLGYPYIVDLEGRKIKRTQASILKEQPYTHSATSTLEEKIEKLLDLFKGSSIPIAQSIQQPQKQKVYMSLSDAIQFSEKLHLQDTIRRSSRRSIISHAKKLQEYLIMKKLNNIDANDFSIQNAYDLTDFWITTDIKNSTFNNKLAYATIFFGILYKRGIVVQNVFKDIDPKKVAPTEASPYTVEEMQLITARTKQKNIYLYFAQQLAFYCLIRQEELARLRFNYFDIRNCKLNLIETKNGKTDVIDVPKWLIDEMKEEGFFAKRYANYYIWGKGIKPHPSEMISERAFNKANLRIKKGLIKSHAFIIRAHTSFRSFRLAGFNFWGEKLNDLERKQHFRHCNEKMDEIYYRKKRHIETIRTAKKIF